MTTPCFSFALPLSHLTDHCNAHLSQSVCSSSPADDPESSHRRARSVLQRVSCYHRVLCTGSLLFIVSYSQFSHSQGVAWSGSCISVIPFAMGHKLSDRPVALSASVQTYCSNLRVILRSPFCWRRTAVATSGDCCMDYRILVTIDFPGFFYNSQLCHQRPDQTNNADVMLVEQHPCGSDKKKPCASWIWPE